MIIYHFYWDLGYFGFIDLREVTQGLGLFFAQLIGISFITIAGISSRLLSLFNSCEAKIVKRIFRLMTISITISILTFILDKNSFIFFGILHFLSVCSIISLVLIKIKSNLLLFLIFLVTGLISLSEMTFNIPFIFSWLGLNKQLPLTNDFYPIIPWITFYFFGFWLGGTIYKIPNKKYKNLSNTGPQLSVVLKLIEYMGQKSLIIYILHQPLLFSLFFIYLQLIS
tara:strand:- start:199 stop:876 length:678 start_codon:yes stop_codon:yes gene_type:complete